MTNKKKSWRSKLVLAVIVDAAIAETIASYFCTRGCATDAKACYLCIVILIIAGSILIAIKPSEAAGKSGIALVVIGCVYGLLVLQRVESTIRTFVPTVCRKRANGIIHTAIQTITTVAFTYTWHQVIHSVISRRHIEQATLAFRLTRPNYTLLIHSYIHYPLYPYSFSSTSSSWAFPRGTQSTRIPL